MKLMQYKYMELNKIQAIKDEITTKKQHGDFVVLSKILEINVNTAVARFNRNNKTTVLIMKKIVENREHLISKLRNSYGNLK